MGHSKMISKFFQSVQKRLKNKSKVLNNFQMTGPVEQLFLQNFSECQIYSFDTSFSVSGSLLYQQGPRIAKLPNLDCDIINLVGELCIFSINTFK